MGYQYRHAAFIAASVGTRCLRYAEIDTERGAKISAQMTELVRRHRKVVQLVGFVGRVVVASGAVPARRAQ